MNAVLRNISCSLFFLLLSQLSVAQRLIVGSVKLEGGIYKNFGEFKYNSPSIKMAFTVKKIFKGYGFLNASPHYIYRLVPDDPKALTSKDAIWGFCDGDSVYINVDDHYKKRNVHEKILYLGRYCYFETVETTFGPIVMMPNAAGGMTPIGGGRTRSLNRMFLDINFEETRELNKASLRELLGTDPGLLHKFEDEKGKGKKLDDYLILYSKKHADEIKR